VKAIIQFLIKKFLPGYSLHRKPPKGIKRKRKPENHELDM